MSNVVAQKKNLRGDALFNNLISYWRLNEASSTRYDSYGSNNLTDNNTVTRVNGKQSSAAEFVAANSEYLSIASNASLQVGNIDFTICGWVYLSNKTNFQTLFSKYLSAGEQRQWLVDYNQSSDRFRLLVSSDGTASVIGQILADNLGSPSATTWYFICAWHDSVNDTLNIQINNGPVSSTSFSTGIFGSGTGDFMIGGSANLTSSANGYIDEVGFWKRTLTQGERTRLYNSGFGLTVPFDQLSDRLVSHWKLNEISGTRADSVGGNTLTDNNTVTRSDGKQSGAGQFTKANTESLSYSSATPFSFGDADFTFAAWVYLDSKDTSMLIVAKYSLDTVRDYLVQYVTSSDFFRLFVYDGVNSIGNVTSSAGVSTSSWYFVVAHHDSVNNRLGLSVNGGNYVFASTSGSAASTASLFYIGNREGGASSPWDGRIDEVSVWKRLLTQQEVVRLYNNGNGLSFPFNSLQDRLISYWKLDETSGTRYDSNLANDLGDNNTVPYTTGKVSNAADFTASSSEYLNVASNATLTTGDIDFTYAGWMNLRAKNFLDFQIILSKRNGGTNEREITIDFDRVADRFRASISSNGTSSSTVSANNFGSPNINTWYFFMVWYDSKGKTINISINNGPANSVSHSGGAYVGTAQFCLGAGNTTADTFLDGYLDEVGFWKRLLTPDERIKLYQSFQATTYPFK